MTARVRLYVAASFTWFSSIAAAQGELSITPLPFDYAWRVAGDGSTVAGSSGSNLDGNLTAYSWSSSAGAQAIGAFAPHGVSYDGSVVVGRRAQPSIYGDAYVEPVSGDRAWCWDAVNGAQDMGFLHSGDLLAGATDVSADGNVITGFSGKYMGPSASFRAWRWTPATGMVELPQPPNGHGMTIGDSISSDGERVFGYSRIGGWPDNSRRGYHWDNNGTTVEELLISDLPDPSASLKPIRNVLNGTVVFNGVYSWSQDAEYWQTDGIWPAPPDDGVNPAYPLTVSEDGQSVIGWAEDFDGPFYFRAYIWTAASGARYLDDVLANAGVSLAGWSFGMIATDVSDDGQTIVGYGAFNGATRAFVVRGLPPCGPGIGMGDGNMSGSTDGLDIQAFVNILISDGASGVGYCAYDMNGDGIVDASDTSLFVSRLLIS